MFHSPWPLYSVRKGRFKMVTIICLLFRKDENQNITALHMWDNLACLYVTGTSSDGGSSGGRRVVGGRRSSSRRPPADLTDSGVSVVSDSGPSLTPSASSTERWVLLSSGLLMELLLFCHQHSQPSFKCQLCCVIICNISKIQVSIT